MVTETKTKDELMELKYGPRTSFLNLRKYFRDAVLFLGTYSVLTFGPVLYQMSLDKKTNAVDKIKAEESAKDKKINEQETILNAYKKTNDSLTKVNDSLIKRTNYLSNKDNFHARNANIWKLKFDYLQQFSDSINDLYVNLAKNYDSLQNSSETKDETITILEGNNKSHIYNIEKLTKENDLLQNSKNWWHDAALNAVSTWGFNNLENMINFPDSTKFPLNRPELRDLRKMYKTLKNEGVKVDIPADNLIYNESQ